MRFNETTHIISICVLILTAIYTLVYSGVSGILLCAAVAFIAAAFIQDIELVVAVTILFVLLYNMVLKQYLRRFEGFENTPGSITERIRAASDTDDKDSDVKRSFSNPAYMEGFEDVSNDKDSMPAPTVTKGEVDSTAVAEVTSAVEEKKKNDTVAK